jgi:hypothetical protein
MKQLLIEWKRFLQEEMKDEPPQGFIVVIGGNRRRIEIKLRTKQKVNISPRFPNGRYKYAGELYIDRSITVSEGQLYEVESVHADKGYGPLLYDIAMELVNSIGGVGLIADRRSIMPAAKHVWKTYFDTRSDVEHKELPQDLFAGALSDREPYLKFYYYKTSTPILDKLKQNNQLNTDEFISDDNL